MGFSRVFPSGRPAAPAAAAVAAAAGPARPAGPAGPAGPAAAGPAAELALFLSEYWQKTRQFLIGFQNTFLVRFRGVSVLHCHGVLVWRRAVFSTGGSTTGKGSQNWQKAIFNRISEGTLDTFLVRFRGVSVLHCHGVLVWRSIGKRLFLIGLQKGR